MRPKESYSGKFGPGCYNLVTAFKGDLSKEEWLMTNEEMQKTMEFIVDQQAQSSTKIDALADAQRSAEERWTRSEDRWSRTEEGIRALLSIAEIHEREINNLGHQVSSLIQEISNLSETTRATDGRLNVLINVVEQQQGRPERQALNSHGSFRHPRHDETIVG